MVKDSYEHMVDGLLSRSVPVNHSVSPCDADFVPLAFVGEGAVGLSDCGRCRVFVREDNLVAKMSGDEVPEPHA